MANARDLRRHGGVDRRSRFPNDWRNRVPPALTRMLAAVGFGSVPAFEDRFATLALPLVCLLLAAFSAMVSWLVRRSEARDAWPLSATDAVTLIAFVPLIVVAAGVAAADARVASAGEHFTAAALATMGVLAIVALVGATCAAGTPSLSGLAILPPSLLVAAALAGADRFTGASLVHGLSAAWLVAALATLADGLTPSTARSAIPSACFAAFAVIVTVISRGEQAATISRGDAALALVATAAAGGVLLVAPSIATRLNRSISATARGGADGLSRR